MELIFSDILITLLVVVGISTSLILFKNAYDRRKVGRYKAAISFSMLSLAFVTLAVAHLRELSFVDIPYHFFLAFMGLSILFLFIFVTIGLNLEKYAIYMVVVYVLSIGGLMSTPFPVAYTIIYTLMDIVGIVTIAIFVYMYLRIHSFGPFGFAIGLTILLFLTSFVYTGIINLSHDVSLRFYLVSFVLVFVASIFGAEKSILKGLANFLGVVLLIFGLAHGLYSAGLSLTIDYTLLFFGLGVGGLGLAVLVGTFVKKYQTTNDIVSYIMAIGMAFVLVYHLILMEYITIITFSENPFVLSVFPIRYSMLLIATGFVILMYGLVRIYNKPFFNNLIAAYYTATILYIAFFSEQTSGLLYNILVFIMNFIIATLPASVFIYYGLRLLKSRIFGGGIPLSIGIGILLYSLANMAIMWLENYIFGAILSFVVGFVLLSGNSGYLDKALIIMLKKGGS